MEALLSITIVILGLILIPTVSLLCYIAYKIGYKKGRYNLSKEEESLVIDFYREHKDFFENYKEERK